MKHIAVAAFVDELGVVIASFAASCADKIVIIGDLNAPRVDGSHIDDEPATLFESFSMTQFVDSPTRGENLLDVIASSDPSAIEGFSVNDGGRLSDHQLIVAKLASIERNRILVTNVVISRPLTQSPSSVSFAILLYSAVLRQPSMASRNGFDVSSLMFLTALHPSMSSSATTESDVKVAVERSRRR